MRIPFFTKRWEWREAITAHVESIASKLSSLAQDNGYRDRRLHRLEEDVSSLTTLGPSLAHDIEESRTALVIDEATLDTLGEIIKKHDRAIELLLFDQVSNSNIGITSKGDLKDIKKKLPGIPDIPLAVLDNEKGIPCAMTLTNKKGKDKIRTLSLARKIVNYLIRMGEEWSIQSEIKELLLGEDAVNTGGGHFSRTVSALVVRELVERDKYDCIRLTTRGKAQASFVWNNMREYNSLVKIQNTP